VAAPENPRVSEAEARFCIQCGAELVTRHLYGEQRPACPACGWVHFTDPKVAAAVIVEQDGRVLLTRRVNEPYRGLWTLPAGFVNAYEDPAAAAVRECREETGLEVHITALVDVIAGREHRRGADIVIVYRAQITGGTLQPGDDADAADFFDYSSLPPLAFVSTRQVLAAKDPAD
jgi:ADP-ribose pyrophosphatase YjhB (NUDIX family)